jgi:hypothetical protein
MIRREVIMSERAIDDYDIFEHRHRFGIWAADQAVRLAALSKGGIGVEEVATVIERTGLKSYAFNPGSLPEPQEFEAWHCGLRICICHYLNCGTKRTKELSHGFAAKIVGVYFKTTIITCNFDDHPKMALLHPPIDRKLLTTLASDRDRAMREAAQAALKKRWSNLGSSEYEELIAAIRSKLDGLPLWKIEAFWEPVSERTARGE